MIRILFVSLIIGISLHDFHFSKTVSEYNSETKTLQTVSNFFTDDLEKAIKQTHGIDLRLGEQDEYAKADSLIQEYMFENFEIRTATKPLDLDWIGYEFDYDIVYTYIESEVHECDSTYSVKLNFFNEIFDDQENFIKINLPDQTITDITNISNTVADFNE